MSIPFYGNVEINNNLSVKGQITGPLSITGTTVAESLQIKAPRWNIGKKQYTNLEDHPGNATIVGWNRIPSGLFVYNDVDTDADQNQIDFINKPGGANWFNMLHINGLSPNNVSSAGIMQIAGDFTGRLFFRNGNHNGWYSKSDPANGGWRALIDSSGGQTIDGALTLHPISSDSLMIKMDKQSLTRTIRFIMPEGNYYKALGQLAWANELIVSSNVKPVLISNYLLSGEWKGLRIDSKKIKFFDKDVMTGCKFEAYEAPLSGTLTIETSNDFLVGEMRLLHVWRDTSKGKNNFQFQLTELSGTYNCALLVVSSDDDHNDMWMPPSSYTTSSINKVLSGRAGVWGGNKELDDNFIGAYLWIQRAS